MDKAESRCEEAVGVELRMLNAHVVRFHLRLSTS